MHVHSELPQVLHYFRTKKNASDLIADENVTFNDDDDDELLPEPPEFDPSLDLINLEYFEVRPIRQIPSPRSDVVSISCKAYGARGDIRCDPIVPTLLHTRARTYVAHTHRNRLQAHTHQKHTDTDPR